MVRKHARNAARKVLDAGGKVSLSRAVKAKCRECMAGYRSDCAVVSCPLYAWMVYGSLEPDLSWAEQPIRVMTDNQRKYLDRVKRGEAGFGSSAKVPCKLRFYRR